MTTPTEAIDTWAHVERIRKEQPTLHPFALRAYQGRVDARFALVAIERGLLPPGIYRETDDNPAAIAYQRMLYRPGWGNRSARRRGWLGFDMLPVPTAERRLVWTR